MRLIATLIMLMCFTGAKAGDTLRHARYTSVFDSKKKIPRVVFYTLRAKDIMCDERINRTNNFNPDPLLYSETNLGKDYKGSGYDCGHNMPAEDNDCNPFWMLESFYYSNMFPQSKRLNRGVWRALENRERKYAIQYDSVLCYVGSYGQIKTIGPDKVSVPSHIWKVLCYDGKCETYIFPNTDDVQGKVEDFITHEENKITKDIKRKTRL